MSVDPQYGTSSSTRVRREYTGSIGSPVFDAALSNQSPSLVGPIRPTSQTTSPTAASEAFQDHSNSEFCKAMYLLYTGMAFSF
jgi:hypothetical protein